jgi:hypothetical protein
MVAVAKGEAKVKWLAIVLTMVCTAALARDPDGRYANSPLKPWFDSLKSGRGPCCSDADGTALSDADWESKDGRYRVRVPAKEGSRELVWVDVPDDAVITEPNLAGRTMVWPMYKQGSAYGTWVSGVYIRCFMPGPMT